MSKVVAPLPIAIGNLSVCFVDQLHRTGDRGGTLINKVFERHLLLAGQFHDASILGGLVHRGQHLPKGVPVVVADVVAQVVFVIERNPQFFAHFHECPVVDRLGVDHHAVEVKYNRFKHTESVRMSRAMGKVAGIRRFGRPIPYHIDMNKACSPRQRPGYDEAISRVLARVVRLEAEPVPLAGVLGCVLAEPVIADRDQPPFNRSTMDGYAVRSPQITEGAEFDVVATISAGAALDTAIDLTRGVAAIATGAVVPDAYDAVIPLEQAEEQAGRVRFGVSRVAPGAYIHARGSDAVAGRVLIEPGELLGPAAHRHRRGGGLCSASRHTKARSLADHHG